MASYAREPDGDGFMGVSPKWAFPRPSRGHTAKVSTGGTFMFPDRPLIQVTEFSYTLPYAGSFHDVSTNVPLQDPWRKNPPPHDLMASDEPMILTSTNTTVQSTTSSLSAASMDHRLTLGTLGIAWLLFAMFAGMAMHQLCQPRVQQRKKMAIVRSYLTRFKNTDVKVYKSPPGGFNVLYNRKRLVNRLKYYWTGELPDPEDASTIVFESDVEEQSEHESRRRQSHYSCWTLSSTSSSEGHWDEDSSSFSSSSSSSSNRSENKSATNTHHSNNNNSNKQKQKNTRRRSRVQTNIVRVLQSSAFSLADVRLENSSMSEDGFSVTFRRESDEDSEEVIDFCIMTKDTRSPLSCFPELDLLHGEANRVHSGDEKAAGDGRTESECDDEDCDFS